MSMECANWACLHRSSSPGVSPMFPEFHSYSSDGVTQLPSSSSWSFSSNGDLPTLGPFGLLDLLILIRAQLCLTLCDPMDCSLPGSSVHGIFQARILEWIAIHYFRGCSWHRDWTCISCISCFGREILYQLHHLGSPLGPFGLLVLMMIFATFSISHWGGPSLKLPLLLLLLLLLSHFSRVRLCATP